jgi:hypothetical protein
MRFNWDNDLCFGVCGQAFAITPFQELSQKLCPITF